MITNAAARKTKARIEYLPGTDRQRVRFELMNVAEPVVAVSFLTQRELELVGHQLRTLYHLEISQEFEALLVAIDKADEQRSGRVTSPPSQG